MTTSTHDGDVVAFSYEWTAQDYPAYEQAHRRFWEMMDWSAYVAGGEWRARRASKVFYEGPAILTVFALILIDELLLSTSAPSAPAFRVNRPMLPYWMIFGVVIAASYFSMTLFRRLEPRSGSALQDSFDRLANATYDLQFSKKGFCLKGADIDATYFWTGETIVEVWQGYLLVVYSRMIIVVPPRAMDVPAVQIAAKIDAFVRGKQIA